MPLTQLVIAPGSGAKELREDFEVPGVQRALERAEILPGGVGLVQQLEQAVGHPSQKAVQGAEKGFRMQLRRLGFPVEPVLTWRPATKELRGEIVGRSRLMNCCPEGSQQRAVSRHGVSLKRAIKASSRPRLAGQAQVQTRLVVSQPDVAVGSGP